jgi:hypothetical protein
MRIPVTDNATESVALGAGEQILMPLAPDLVNPGFNHVPRSSSVVTV